MTTLLHRLTRALDRLRGGDAPAGPDPASPLARALISAVGPPGTEPRYAEAARQGLIGAHASTPEGAVLLEAARVVGSCAAGETADPRLLEEAARGLLGPDGAARGDLPALLDAVAALALARAWLHRRALALPPEAEAALVRGADLLYRLQGEQDGLPTVMEPVDAPSDPLIPGPCPLAWSLRDAVLAWGLDEGAPASDADPLARALAGRAPEGTPGRLAGDRWALWTWRETGLAVAHTQTLRRPTRLFLDARTGGLRWDMPGLRLLSGGLVEGAPARGALQSARVDGRKLRLVCADPTRGWSRDVLAQGARVIVRDKGIQQIRFIVPSFDYARTADGWLGRGSGLSLEIKVEAGVRWTLDGGALLGLREGEAGEVQASFELRT